MMHLDKLLKEYETKINVTLKVTNDLPKIVEENTEIRERAIETTYNIKKIREKEVNKKRKER